MIVFEERTETLEYPGKNLSDKGREPAATNSTQTSRIQTRSHIDVRRVF